LENRNFDRKKYLFNINLQSFIMPVSQAYIDFYQQYGLPEVISRRVIGINKETGYTWARTYEDRVRDVAIGTRGVVVLYGNLIDVLRASTGELICSTLAETGQEELRPNDLE
jgi:hypothetical protein